jgi:hypothetical protein
MYVLCTIIYVCSTVVQSTLRHWQDLAFQKSKLYGVVRAENLRLAMEGCLLCTYVGWMVMETLGRVRKKTSPVLWLSI